MSSLLVKSSIAPPLLERTNVLGVGISAINYDVAIETIDAWIEGGRREYVAVTGVHGVMESQRSEPFRQLLNRAGMVTPDGMPMVWLSKLAGRKHVQRVYGPNLMLQVCERSVEKGHRHFLFGGAPGVADQLANVLVERFPGIQIAGTHCPPFRPLTAAESEAITTEINLSNADIVWVGLSTPKQERWMAEHRGRIDAAVLLGVGAAFDFHTGRVKQAPKWIQQSGLEWLFRLALEPRRLWRRYLTNNPLFVFYLLLTACGLRKRRALDNNESSDESCIG